MIPFYEFEQELAELSRILNDLDIAIAKEDMALVRAIREVYQARFDNMYESFDTFTKDYFLQRRQ